MHTKSFLVGSLESESVTRREALARAGRIGMGLAVGSSPASAMSQAPPEAPHRKLKIVVAGGHPGDAEYGCGGTIARYTDLGHEVVLLHLNNGEWPAEKGGAPAGVRLAEARKAAEILKARTAYAGQVRDKKAPGSPMKLKRFAGNPILSPNPGNAWENLAVFNPGACYDERSRTVWLLYRAAESGPEYKCYLGLARSSDGCHFERVSDQPAMDVSGEGFDGATLQDPRLIRMGDWFYVTYACRHYPFGQFWIPEVRRRYVTPDCPPEFPRYLRTNATLTGLAMTKDFKHWIRAGWLTHPLLDDRDVVLFPEKVNGQFVMMHRPLEWVGPDYGTEQACAWIAASDDLLGFPFARSRLLIKDKYPWECYRMGINTPPIKTPHGWFTLYHAVGPDKFYRLGALLLDLQDPGRVLHRTPDWLMQPEADYEIEGFYRGVCFPCGTVVLDGTLFVYYGGADKYCALATCDFEELLAHLQTCPP